MEALIHISAPPSPKRKSIRRWEIGIYFGVLTLSTSFADPTGVVSIPVLFLLKDHLHLGAGGVALFEVITMLPHYLAFVFGVLRDRMQQFGISDRAYLLVAAPVAACCYLWLGAGSRGYTALLAAMVVAMIAYQFLDTAGQALMTSVGQRRMITGRLSALTELLEAGGSLAAAFAGGWMMTHASLGTIFLVAAGVTGFIFVQGFWKTKAVFVRHSDAPAHKREIRSLRGLLNHRKVALTIAILALYNFSPGWGTPLFYYLTERLHMSPEAYGIFKAANFAGMAGATAVYGFFCIRFSLKRLLWFAIVMNIFPGFLFLATHNAPQAIIVAGTIGLLGGFAHVALFDLLMRSCPENSEGTASMLAISAFGIAGATGDLLGAWLYERAGLAICITIDAVATLMILPLVRRFPSNITSFKDGELWVAPLTPKTPVVGRPT